MGPPITSPTASQNRALWVPSEPVILLSTPRSVQRSDWSQILNIGRKLPPLHDGWIRLSKTIPECGPKIRTLRAFINSAQLDLSGWSIFLQPVRSNHTSFWSETLWLFIYGCGLKDGQSRFFISSMMSPLDRPRVEQRNLELSGQFVLFWPPRSIRSSDRHETTWVSSASSSSSTWMCWISKYHQNGPRKLVRKTRYGNTLLF